MKHLFLLVFCVLSAAACGSPEGQCQRDEDCGACHSCTFGVCELDPEICGDGLDNDCDGRIDEGCPCDGVVCDQPPAAECVGDELRSYRAPGSCVPETGECAYDHQDTLCPLGCDAEAGACLGCDNRCSPVGASECLDGQIRTCVADAQGCLDWSAYAACEVGFCESATACGSCEDACNPGQSRCADGRIRTCEADEHGCLVWGPESDCEDGFCADESRCGTCDDRCEPRGATQCAAGRIRSCEADEHGCLGWGAYADCASGFCDQDGVGCGDCDDRCSPAGATDCAAGRIRICEADGDGCLDWGEYTDCDDGFCADGQTCGVCENPCSDGQTQCEAGQIRACGTDAHGCFVWGDYADCDDGFCADGQTCGDCDAQPCMGGDGCCPAGCDGFEDFDCLDCDLLVPDAYSTISEAIDQAPSYSTICVAPGTYTEDLVLRPHVSIYGSGVGTQVLGKISAYGLGDPDPAPTVVANFHLEAGYLAAISSCHILQTDCNPGSIDLDGDAFALVLDHIDFTEAGGGSTVYAGWFGVYGGQVDLAVRDSVWRTDRGIRLSLVAGYSEGYDVHVAIERNRFEPSDGFSHVYDAVDLGINNPAGSAYNYCDLARPAGTQIDVTIRNNEFVQTTYEGIYTWSCLTLDPGDVDGSGIFVLHNTFVSGDGRNAIWNNNASAGEHPHLVVANNLYWNVDTPVRGPAPFVNVTNQSPASSPFLDLDQGDLRLAPGSTPIDAASPEWAPAEDIAGVPRPLDGDGDGSELPDIGAHEYVR